MIRPALSMLAVIALLAACDQRGPPSNSAVANPKQFAAAKARSHEWRSPADENAEQAPRGNSAPGVGMRHGRVRGANAGHLGLQMVLQAVVSADGTLIHDRLNSSMNMDLLEQAISAFTNSDLPGDRVEQLVFYSNAYNANALAILTMFAIDPDADFLGDASDAEQTAEDAARARFDEQPVMVAGQPMTMGELRDEHILGFGDPRVLAYLIDPDPEAAHLPRESLWPRNVDAQLDAMCAQWVNAGTLASVSAGELHLGPLLRRHAHAFEVEAFGGVLGFLEQYAKVGGPLAQALAASTASPTPATP